MGHFPCGIIHSAPPPENIHLFKLVQMRYKDVVRWFWKDKRWRVQLNGVAYNASTNYSDPLTGASGYENIGHMWSPDAPVDGEIAYFIHNLSGGLVGPSDPYEPYNRPHMYCESGHLGVFTLFHPTLCNKNGLWVQDFGDAYDTGVINEYLPFSMTVWPVIPAGSPVPDLQEDIDVYIGFNSFGMSLHAEAWTVMEYGDPWFLGLASNAAAHVGIEIKNTGGIPATIEFSMYYPWTDTTSPPEDLSPVVASSGMTPGEIRLHVDEKWTY